MKEKTSSLSQQPLKYKKYKPIEKPLQFHCWEYKLLMFSEDVSLYHIPLHQSSSTSVTKKNNPET